MFQPPRHPARRGSWAAGRAVGPRDPRLAQLVNTIGAHLSEFGLVVAKAIHNVERLLAALRVVLTDATSVSRQIRSRAGVLAGALAVPPGGLRRPPRELRRQILGGVCMGFA